MRTAARLGWLQSDGEQASNRPTSVLPPSNEEWRQGAIELQKLEAYHALPFQTNLVGTVRTVLRHDAFMHPARVLRLVWPHGDTWPSGEFIHQDWSIFHIPDLVTTWYPLHDLTMDLGPLHVLRGSHRNGTIGRK